MNDIPKVKAEMQGQPIDEQLEAVFSPWGKLSGVMVAEGVVHAYFEDNTVLLFAPVASYHTETLETIPERLN